MNTINTIHKLADEMAVIAEILKEMPLPYKTIITNKITGFNAYLAKILTIETESNNYFQNLGSDLLTELESQQFEE